MPNRREFLIATSLAVLLATAGLAGADVPFTMQAFHAAQAAGKPILVDIAATWCPTCKAQAPIIKDLTSRDAYQGIVVFRVDFDSQSDVVREFGARMQSTLIVFRGKSELARSVGSTDPAEIEALLAKAASGT